MEEPPAAVLPHFLFDGPAAGAEPAPPNVDFEAEVHRCQGQLFRIAVGLLGSEADAKDVVQEALIRAYTRLYQYRGDSAFSTWLVRIVYRASYDELRRRGRRPLPWAWPSTDRPAASDPGTGPLPGATAESGAWSAGLGDGRGWQGLPGAMVAGTPDPAESAEQHEQQRLVWRAVKQLTPPFRTVMAMHLQGRSYEEMAAALRLPVGTVKSRLHRARLCMKRELAQNPAVSRPSAG